MALNDFDKKMKHHKLAMELFDNLDKPPGYKDMSDRITKLEKKQASKHNKKSLSEVKINFDDDGALLIIGDTQIQLRPHTNQSCFCKVLFDSKVGKFIGWDLIYEEITGNEPDDIERNQKTVMDTMYKLNTKITEKTGRKGHVFTRDNKSIKRNY
jgi:hypothetical protein